MSIGTILLILLVLALVGVRPDKTTQAGEIAPRDYRFTFEARR